MRCRFDPWVKKIPWRRAWQPTPIFLPGESPWKEEPGELQSMGSQSDMTEWLRTAQHKPFLGSQRVRHDWVTEQYNKNLLLQKRVSNLGLTSYAIWDQTSSIHISFRIIPVLIRSNWLCDALKVSRWNSMGNSIISLFLQIQIKIVLH